MVNADHSRQRQTDCILGAIEITYTYIYTPYVAKFSRLKNSANRFHKGGAEIFATKIFTKAALIHCVIL